MQTNNLLFGSTTKNSVNTDVGLLLLRLLAGLSLAFAHGLGKLPPSDGFVSMLGNVGLPAPGLLAWLSGFAEFGGGLLLAIGLLTRPAALFIIINMSVALIFAHAGDAFAEREKAILFCSIALLYLFSGAGRYSLDAGIRKKRP